MPWATHTSAARHSRLALRGFHVLKIFFARWNFTSFHCSILRAGPSIHAVLSLPLPLAFLFIASACLGSESFYLTGVWRNGSASDSRSEGWEFESLCPHFSNLVDIPLGIPRSMVSCFGDSALNVGLGSTARLRAQSARRHVRTECPQLKFVCAPITSGFLYTALWPNG